MSSNDELNIAVGEAAGWTYDGESKKPNVALWSRDGMRWDTKLPNFCGDANEAIGLLDGHGWVVHTCDAGYKCCIHKAPEEGEIVIGQGVGDTPAEAICRAFLEMKKGKGTNERRGTQRVS